MSVPKILAAPQNEVSRVLPPAEHAPLVPETPPNVPDQISSCDCVNDCWQPFTNLIVSCFESLIALVCHLVEQIVPSSTAPEVLPTMETYKDASVQLLTFISRWSDTLAGGSVWNSNSGVPWDCQAHGAQFIEEFHALPDDAQIKVRTYLHREFSAEIEKLQGEILREKQAKADPSALSPEESLKLACDLYLQRNAPSDALIDVIREQQRITHKLFKEALRSIPPAELLANKPH